MKQLWAPWRMTYLKDGAMSSEECVFCEAIGHKQDRERLILRRGKSCFVILNKYPYNCGHIMAIPYRHTADFLSLTAEESQEMIGLMKLAMKALNQTIGPMGFNMGLNLGAAAGAGIKEHLHMHVVPRWIGDTNFMPVLGEVRAIPEHLLATYDNLVSHFEGKETP